MLRFKDTIQETPLFDSLYLKILGKILGSVDATCIFFVHFRSVEFQKTSIGNKLELNFEDLKK